ncbi:Ger(x)C family spore germination protein [Paenibacillus bouchesdurhonensis]|uniref:Ger(x)C family spore germination protein n=1 Tax=Paenibacillus bouchesdurhonensis TaxID=1870990 RepID=UPI001F3D7ACE|nr:Ger(x)C family spore germination protein [Paenibacillus bouchesdurhonensis]
MMMKRMIGAALILCCAALLTGCWDALELNRRAIVAGIGIDHTPEAEDQFMISFQVVIADEISGKTGRGATPTSIYNGTGRTISGAIRNVSRKVPRLTSTAHARLIVISEAVARRGIAEIMDFLDRDSDIRLTADVVIAKGDVRAKDVVATLMPIGKISAYSLSQKVELASGQLGANYQMEIDDILRDLLTPGGGPVINSLEVIGDVIEAGKKSNLETVESSGIVVVGDLAIFKDDKLVDWLNRDESRGMVWIKNKTKKTSLFIDSDREFGDIAVDVIRSKTGLKAQLSDPSHPVMQVSVNALLSIREVDTHVDLRNPEVLHFIEQKANEVIAKDLRSVVQKAQSAKSDVFRFGEVIERQSPTAWKEIKERWEDLFPQLEVEYKVNSVIQNTQMRDRSFKYNQDS